ncbi:UNVERIFIED_CONTAM: protein PHLOEM PROTEIN 2-LIKE A10 [Sesamum angustifolium]|uniref:Protein PHLOEM PROTEIN 2-LIKE A10 n=1 Tax=Sesamum angustifolium TaxID=2727405 RepID=A0AAW2IRC1_9LAMI
MAEMLSESVSLITLILKVLKEYLSSNQVEIPNSLKQLQKIAHSEEFSESVSCVSQAITIGILRGTEFSLIVLGSFARNLVLGFQAHKKSSYPTWVSGSLMINAERFVADCIRTFVTAAAAVCVNKTMDVNFYGEIFSGMTNPKHQNKLGSVDSGKNIGRIGLKNTGWVDSVLSTLAVPRNRKSVLDVTSKVTFESVKSVVQFSLWKMFEGFNRIIDVIVERGYEVVRYVGAKSSVILTICLVLFLHILCNA